MADNTQLNSATTTGNKLADVELTFSGDTAHVQVCGLGILSGSEGSWTCTHYVGGAGAVTAGTQRVTLASDDPAVALLTTIDADTSKITACNTGAVVISSGTITTVSSVTAIANALPAGTNAIGKLAANSGVDIGDVDVTSIVPGTAATNLGKARGSAAGATDTGVAPLAVRNDELADLAGADVDYTPLQVNEEGALFVTGATAKEQCASGVAASGTTAIVALHATKKIKIHALFLKATSATVTNVYLATTTDTDVLGNSGNPIPLAVDADGDNDSGFVLPYNPGGWTVTSTANEALNLILSAAQDVIWAITWSYVA